VLAQDPLEVRPSLGVLAPPPRELLGRVQARERGLLGRGRDVEGAPDLPDRGHDRGRREAVAHAEPGEPVDLRERAEDDDSPALLQVALDAVGVVGVVDVLGVGLVENGDDVPGHALEPGVELGPRVRRAGRVVREADVGDLRERPDRLQHGLEVVAAAPQGNRARDGAELARGDHIARERRPAADDLVARLERCLAQAVDEPV
jgi:hypothetical protein